MELERAERSGDWARAGEIKYGKIPELEGKLANAANMPHAAMINEEVTDEDIAAIVSRWTGIPVDKMLAGEREKLREVIRTGGSWRADCAGPGTEGGPRRAEQWVRRQVAEPVVEAPRPSRSRCVCC